MARSGRFKRQEFASKYVSDVVPALARFRAPPNGRRLACAGNQLAQWRDIAEGLCCFKVIAKTSGEHRAAQRPPGLHARTVIIDAHVQVQLSHCSGSSVPWRRWNHAFSKSLNVLKSIATARVRSSSVAPCQSSTTATNARICFGSAACCPNNAINELVSESTTTERCDLVFCRTCVAR